MITDTFTLNNKIFAVVDVVAVAERLSALEGEMADAGSRRDFRRMLTLGKERKALRALLG